MHNPIRLIACGLILLLVSPSAILTAQDSAAPDRLQINIVAGDHAILNARRHAIREPVVQVQDERRQPVPGAVVVFTLPDQGAGATFLNGARSLTVTADSQGQAVARGLRPNSLAGQFEIRVNASFAGQTGHAVIHLENAVPAAAGHAYVKWIVIAAVAGGVAGGVLASRGSSSPKSTSQTITLTPVTGAVGAP